MILSFLFFICAAVRPDNHGRPHYRVYCAIHSRGQQEKDVRLAATRIESEQRAAVVAQDKALRAQIRETSMFDLAVREEELVHLRGIRINLESCRVLVDQCKRREKLKKQLVLLKSSAHSERLQDPTAALSFLEQLKTMEAQGMTPGQQLNAFPALAAAVTGTTTTLLPPQQQQLVQQSMVAMPPAATGHPYHYTLPAPPPTATDATPIASILVQPLPQTTATAADSDVGGRRSTRNVRQRREEQAAEMNGNLNLGTTAAAATPTFGTIVNAMEWIPPQHQQHQQQQLHQQQQYQQQQLHQQQPPAPVSAVHSTGSMQQQQQQQQQDGGGPWMTTSNTTASNKRARRNEASTAAAHPSRRNSPPAPAPPMMMFLPPGGSTATSSGAAPGMMPQAAAVAAVSLVEKDRIMTSAEARELNSKLPPQFKYVPADQLPPSEFQNTTGGGGEEVQQGGDSGDGAAAVQTNSARAARIASRKTAGGTGGSGITPTGPSPAPSENTGGGGGGGGVRMTRSRDVTRN